MAPKLLPMLVVLLCAFVLISSRVQVTAEEPTAAEEQKSEAATGDAVHESKQVHGCSHGCCGWFRGRCIRCCHPKTVAETVVGENKQVIHGCRHGCCGVFRQRCVRCCSPKTTKAAEAEPRN